MTEFKDYAEKYSHIRMERRDGILEITFHSDGKTLVWGGGPHGQFGPAFHDIAQDRENKLVIMTGTGDAFIEEINAEILGERLPKSKITPTTWDHIYSDAKRLLMNLLDIEVPVIAAVNGPVNIHAEIAVLSDIVLAADHAAFADAPHFPNGLVPGDGVHVIWPYLLGRNRGRYFLLTGQKLADVTVPLVTGLGFTVGWLIALRFALRFFWVSPLIPWLSCALTIFICVLAAKRLLNLERQVDRNTSSTFVQGVVEAVPE